MSKESVAVDIPADATVDVSSLKLEQGKQYKVITEVDASGVTVTSVEEIVPPTPAPSTDLVVVRSKLSGVAYLGVFRDGTWSAAGRNQGDWQSFIQTFDSSWNIVEVDIPWPPA